MRFIFACLLSVFAWSSFAAGPAPQIDITVTSMQDKKGYGGKPQCKFKFSIHNASTGTIYGIRGELTAWDDRGRKVGELLSAAVVNSKSMMSGRTPIPVGATVKDMGDATFKEECKYIAEMKFDQIRDHYCAIRMLPEDTDCSQMVKLKSAIPQIKIRQ